MKFTCAGDLARLGKGVNAVGAFFCAAFRMPSSPSKGEKNDEGYETLEKSDAKAAIRAARSAVEPPPNEWTPVVGSLSLGRVSDNGM
jgi:hypothetical protein